MTLPDISMELLTVNETANGSSFNSCRNGAKLGPASVLFERDTEALSEGVRSIFNLSQKTLSRAGTSISAFGDGVGESIEGVFQRIERIERIERILAENAAASYPVEPGNDPENGVRDESGDVNTIDLLDPPASEAVNARRVNEPPAGTSSAVQGITTKATESFAVPKKQKRTPHSKAQLPPRDHQD
ncbi:hypothetical protein QFC21_006352 [Naganishia friedmannii]|uniref:Uncharacterized protein n=1 Tax=Naganishia friedmannii TaxID=89922 RepID=A0ACC2V2E1_9TREE|nr:hypothetical protein QFC21_006352 [Naganishia friedmannii]